MITTPPGNLRPRRLAVVAGLLIGLIYQLILISVQPQIEPTWVWAEVALGVFLSLLNAGIAMRIIRYQSWPTEFSWQFYEQLVGLSFASVGLPIIVYEIAHHILEIL